MAEGTRQARLDDTLEKLASIQESQANQIASQHTSIDALTNTIRDLSLSLQTLDAKVDQYLRRQPNHHIPPPHHFQHLHPHHIPPIHDPTQLNAPPIKTMRLDIPRFSGENPAAWISRIQRYFDYYNTSDPQRLLIASFHLDGAALDWFDWMHRSQLILDWPTFLLAIEKRFGPSEYEDYFGRLSKLMQTSSLTDYQSQFEQLANKISGTPEHVLVSCFVSGLHHDLRKEVQAYKPHNLIQAMGLTRLYSDKLTDNRFSPRQNQERHWTKPYAQIKPYTQTKPDTLPPLLPTP